MSDDKSAAREMGERFRCIASASVYDALDSLGLPNQCLELGIKPIHPEMRIGGPAFTVKGSRDPRTAAEWQPERLQGNAMHEALYPGCVLVVDPGTKEDGLGVFGEMTSWHFKSLGAAGILADGGIRDRPGLLLIPDWPVFVRYTTPIESYPRFRVMDFEVPIALTGQLVRQVRVAPGDFVVGDADGVVVVPKDAAAEVLAKAEEIWAAEEGTRRDLAAGVPFDEVYRRYGRA